MQNMAFHLLELQSPKEKLLELLSRPESSSASAVAAAAAALAPPLEARWEG